MNNNDPLYKRIREFISLGYDSYDGLPQMEMDELVSLCIDKYDDWIADDDIFMSIRHYLAKPDIDNAIILADTISMRATREFEQGLTERYQEVFDDYKVKEMQERGLSAHVDPINGEVTWRK